MEPGLATSSLALGGSAKSRLFKYPRPSLGRRLCRLLPEVFAIQVSLIGFFAAACPPRLARRG